MKASLCCGLCVYVLISSSLIQSNYVSSMPFNSSSGSKARGVENSDNTELFVAITALLISVAAFVIALLQALHQYYASAKGYSSCGAPVIKKWSEFRHRRFLLYEFRFEVQFEVPIIFVARPENKKGPIEGQKIILINGSDESFEESRTQSTDNYKGKREYEYVHTADNEEATWVALLMAIQRMEKESGIWQRSILQTPVNHSLIVCVQRQKRSWATMPGNISKPYATTTISHLIEFTAMLGIHWKVFDRDTDRYRAQGNGFILSGTYLENLGIAFSFQKKGPTWFETNRVIPHHDVKELCFGLSPTVFRDSGVTQYADEPKDIGTLQLGSMEEIAESLMVLGCNANTANYFRENATKARHGHLFPGKLTIKSIILCLSLTIIKLPLNSLAWLASCSN